MSNIDLLATERLIAKRLLEAELAKLKPLTEQLLSGGILPPGWPEQHAKVKDAQTKFDIATDAYLDALRRSV